MARAQSVKTVRDKGCETALQTIVISTTDLRKRPRKPTVSPHDTAAKKLEVMMPKAYPKEEK